MAFSLGGALAGLGLFAQDYLKKKQVDSQLADAQLRRQQAARQQQAAVVGWNALASGLPADAGGGSGGIADTGSGVGMDGGGAASGVGVPPSLPALPSGNYGLAPGFSRSPMGELTRNGQSPDTYIGLGGGQGSVPAWQEGPIRPLTSADYRDLDQGASGRYSPSGTSQYGTGLTRLTNLGVKPEVASGFLDYMRRNESGLNPRARNPTSGAEGVAQWLGPRKRALEAQYGPASTADQQYDFMGRELEGPERGTLDRLLGARTAKEGYDIAGVSYERPGAAALAKAGVGRGGGGNQWAAPLVRDAVETSRTVAGTINPAAYGRSSLQALAQRIEQANPGADPAVKMMALENLSRILAPGEKRMWDMLKTQHAEDFQREMQDRRQQFDREQTGERERFQREERQTPPAYEPKLFADPQGGRHWLRPGQDVPAGWRETQKGGTGRVENVIAYKGEEKVFEGSARYDPQAGWVNTADGKPIDADRFESTSKGGAGGGRAGAQVQRQVTSGREIQSDLENLTRLPVVTNRGVFGGRQQGPGLMDALKENMAEELTDEDAQLANSALGGIKRELSIVTSPVYGGHWAADQFDALTLKPGQTALVKVYNIARMRQVADNALEAIQNTDWVGAQQKKYAQKVRDDINKAVPWTTQDVLDFRDKSNSGETFAQFVKRNRIGDKAGAGGSTYQDGDTATNPQTGEKVMYRGGKWIPLPAGGVDVAPLGPPT